VLSSILALVRHWASPRDQGLLVGLSMGGMSIATALNNPISATTCYYGGWESIFYGGGLLGLFWVILATFTLYDTPKQHPRVSVEERQYLDVYGLVSENNQKCQTSIPWSDILTSVPVWAAMVTNFFFHATSMGITMTLPLFIGEVLDFTITENGIYSALPSVGNVIVHFATGPIFDHVRSQNALSLTKLRKIFHAAGTVIPAAMLFAVSQVEPGQKYLIIALITVGLALTEVTYVAGYGIVLMDVAPNFMGVLQGINNSLGLSPGFIMPMVIAALTPNASAEEWSHIYLMLGCLISTSGLVFTLTGSARRQTWAATDQVAPI